MHRFSGEDAEQFTVIEWADWNAVKYPQLRWLYHCPNGGKRDVREARKFRQLGVKPGVSDLCLPFPKGKYCGLFIEMKYGNNKLQETQIEFLRDMANAGHFVITCYSGSLAIDVLEKYLSLKENDEMPFKNNSILKEKK